MSKESPLKCVIPETIKDELKNTYQPVITPDVNPRKLWICEADEEDEGRSKRRKKRKIPKTPNPNIGVRNLLFHIHNAAVSTCCIRADHGVGRSTLARHLAYTWASEEDDIPKLKAFEAVFLVSARSIMDELSYISVTSSTYEEHVASDGSILHEATTLPDVKDAMENDKTAGTEFIERQEIECASKCDVEKITCQHLPVQDETIFSVKFRSHMEKAIHALISALLPMSTAIYGPEAVSECVLGMDILLIIDDAEDLQPCGLESLQQVLRYMRGASATTIMLTDPDGYKRITQTWAAMNLIKIDLCGLGREDIVTEGMLYVDAKKTKLSSKLHDSSSLNGVLPDPDESNLEGKETETCLEKDEPNSAFKSTEMLVTAQENVGYSDSNKVESNYSKKTYGRESNISPAEEASKASDHSIHIKDDEVKGENMDTNSKDSPIMNAKTFLDLITGKNLTPKTNDEKVAEACYRPKEIAEFLSRNMCRLEKVLRFPEMLIWTCDMYMDSPDLFEGVTTATDLLWTLIHWEGVNAFCISASNEGLQNCSDYAYNSSNVPGETTKHTEECIMSSRNSISSPDGSLTDLKCSSYPRKSSRLSGDFSEFVQKCSASSGRKHKKLEQIFHEKMYSWLLFLGEESLNAFVNDVRMEEDSFEELRAHTDEMFGVDVADSLLNQIYRSRKFFGFSSVPENVETFVAEHVCANNFHAIQLKPEMFDCETLMSDNIPVNVMTNNDNSVMENLSLHCCSSDDKSNFPEVINTKTPVNKENDAFMSENSEITTKEINNEFGNLVDFASANQRQFEKFEIPSIPHSNENIANTDGCSPENYIQNYKNGSDIKNNALQTYSQDMKHAQDDSCSSNFWDEILGNENFRYPDSINSNNKPEFIESNASHTIVESDFADNNNYITEETAMEDVPEGARLSQECNSPTVTDCGSHISEGTLVLQVLSQDTNETSTKEGTGKSLDRENSVLSCNDEQATPGILPDENGMINETFENKINKTILAEEKKDLSTETSEKNERIVAESTNFNNSNEDFWGEILGSDNTQLELESQFKQNDLHEKYIEKKALHSEEKQSRKQNELEILSSESKFDAVIGQEMSQASCEENMNSENFPEGSLEYNDKLNETNILLMNGNIPDASLNYFPEDSNNHHGITDCCFEKSDSHTVENMASNSENSSSSTKETHILHIQPKVHEFSQENSPVKINSMTADHNNCHLENLDDKLPPTFSSLENFKVDTEYLDRIKKQTKADELRCDNSLGKSISEQVKVHDENLNEQLITDHNKISEDQQICCQDGSLNEQETFCNDKINDEKTEGVEILAEQQQQQQQQKQQYVQEQEQEQEHHQQQEQVYAQQQKQHLSVDGFVKTIQEEHEQPVNNPHETVDEPRNIIVCPRAKSSKEEQEDQEQQHQNRVANMLQDLKNRALTPPPPILTTRNPLLTQFLASWFLVHEIQSGRSLLSLTYGSRRCLRQLCVFAAGLVNRIRKLVGYNTELNRRRLVSALLNHRSDSSYDLPLNMDLVAEFKAYPDLLSFTVEASEYPDEWHLSLYEVQLVPLQALLLNVSPSRIFLNVEEVRPFSEESRVLEFLPRVEILVWLDSGCQFVYGNEDRMDKVVASFTVHVLLAKVELVSGCLTHSAITNLLPHTAFKNLVYLKLRVLDINSLSTLLCIDRKLKHLLWMEIKLDFDWISEDEGDINSLPRCSVPLFDVYFRGCADEHVVRMSSILSHMHQRYSGIHLESTSLTPEGVYVLLKQLKQKEIRLYSHPTARQRFRRWYYPQLADEPAPSDDLARERLGYDDRVFYSNHFVESNTYATAIDAWNLTSFLEEEERIVHFVYTTDNLKFVKKLTGRVEVERTCEG